MNHVSSRRPRPARALVPLAFLTLGSAAFAGACSGDDSSAPPTMGSDAGQDVVSQGDAALVYSTSAAVQGAADDHCGGKPVQVASQASCHPDAAAPAAGDASGDDADGGEDEDEGEGMYGSAGDDDDCKYHEAWESTPITDGGPTTIRVTITSKADGAPVKGGAPYLEVYLAKADGTAVPPINQGSNPATEEAPGVYRFDNVAFGQPGQWTFRVHTFAACDDTPDSPHGHAAFLINVP